MDLVKMVFLTLFTIQLLHMIMLVVMLYLELLYPIGFRIYTEVVSGTTEIIQLF